MLVQTGKPANYFNYLRSTQWKRIRGEYLRRVGWNCERCYTRRAVLIHHLSYHRLGHEQPEDLMALCYDCHEALHRWPDAANDNQITFAFIKKQTGT